MGLDDSKSLGHLALLGCIGLYWLEAKENAESKLFALHWPRLLANFHLIIRAVARSHASPV
jgi:hypothetical protein